MGEREPEKKTIKDGVEIILDEAESAVKSAFRRSGAETLGENLKETLQGVLSSRKNVVMVRLNEDSLEHLDVLVEAGVVSSRSEACAFLIGEGIKTRQDLFSRISDKIEAIRDARQELRDLLNEPTGLDAAEAEDTERQGNDDGPDRQE